MVDVKSKRCTEVGRTTAAGYGMERASSTKTFRARYAEGGMAHLAGSKRQSTAGDGAGSRGCGG